jgi:transcriptional regulator with XRE-family HTH domain
MRAAELGEFLRSRRRRVDPVAAGFPASRRRTPGLRREELASLAGVTVSWLGKLEQGQAHAVSAGVLASLSRALGLDAAEHRHLFTLAGLAPTDAPPPAGEVTPALRVLLDELDPNPAYLLDRCWNIVAWNAGEAALFPELAELPAPRNLLELVFLDPDLRRLMADHEQEMVRLVSQFRVHHTDWAHDAAVAEVVTSLRSRSPRFAALWDARDVAPFASTRRRFHHPTGVRELDHHRLAVLDQPGMQLVVYVPVTDSVP